MEAGKIIHQLLYQADLVILPGLGAFISTYQAARPDPVNRRISPPARIFRFDDSRQEDDEVVLNWIAEQEDLPETEARKMLTDFLADIMHELEAGREVEIPELGSFYKDPGGRVQFRFSVENNFDPETIGLKDIELLELDHEAQHQPEVSKVEEFPPAPPVIEKPQLRQEEPVVVRPVVPKPPQMPPAPPVPPKQAPRKRSYRWVWIVAILLLIIGGGTYLSLQHKAEIKQLAHQWFGRKPKPIDTMALKNATDTGLVKTLAEQARLKKALDVQGLDSTNAFIPYGRRNMKYYIVAASFTTYDNALKMQDELKTKGFDSEIVTQTHEYYRVTMGSYTDKQQAMVELEKMKTITRNNALWLMHI